MLLIRIFQIFSFSKLRSFVLKWLKSWMTEWTAASNWVTKLAFWQILAHALKRFKALRRLFFLQSEELTPSNKVFCVINTLFFYNPSFDHIELRFLASWSLSQHLETLDRRLRMLWSWDILAVKICSYQVPMGYQCLGLVRFPHCEKEILNYTLHIRKHHASKNINFLNCWYEKSNLCAPVLFQISARVISLLKSAVIYSHSSFSFPPHEGVELTGDSWNAITFNITRCCVDNNKLCYCKYN